MHGKKYIYVLQRKYTRAKDINNQLIKKENITKRVYKKLFNCIYNRRLANSTFKQETLKISNNLLNHICIASLTEVTLLKYLSQQCTFDYTKIHMYKVLRCNDIFNGKILKITYVLTHEKLFENTSV